MPAVVESETLRNTLTDVEDEALLDMVADTVRVVENEEYVKTLSDANAKALVHYRNARIQKRRS